MVKLHGGSPGKRQGVLNRGTAPKPSPWHGGTLHAKGRVHDASAPKPSQRSTSWHAMAAASQKRKT
jgi:hypothetical protein